MRFSAELTTAISLLFLFMSSSGHTAGHSSQAQTEHIHHTAHDHSVARLTLAVDGKRLEIMLESPAANLVGFERSAATDEERQKLAEVKAKLAEGQSLFRINPEAECSLNSSEINSALFVEHDDHGEHEGSEMHGDIDATWLFTCADPGALKTVKSGLFTSFPHGFEEIMVEWVTATSASATTIDHDDVINLKQ